MVLYSGGDEGNDESAESGEGQGSASYYTDRMKLIALYGGDGGNNPDGRKDLLRPEYIQALQAFHAKHGYEEVCPPMTSAEHLDIKVGLSGLPTNDYVVDYIDGLFLHEMPMHKDIDPETAKSALLRDERSLLVFKKMMITGHRPDFFMSSENCYVFGTTSVEVPPETYAFNPVASGDSEIAARISKRIGAISPFSQAEYQVLQAYDGARAFSLDHLMALALSCPYPLAPETIWLDSRPPHVAQGQDFGTALMVTPNSPTATINENGSLAVGSSQFTENEELHGMRLYREVHYDPNNLPDTTIDVAKTFHNWLASTLTVKK